MNNVHTKSVRYARPLIAMFMNPANAHVNRLLQVVFIPLHARTQQKHKYIDLVQGLHKFVAHSFSQMKLRWKCWLTALKSM